MLDPTLVPISPEPTLKLLKHLTRRPLKSNDLKLVDQETGEHGLVKSLRQLSASSTPNQSWSPSPDQIPIPPYRNHTGQAMDSDSNSSSKGMENTAGRNREEEKVKWKTIPFEAKLERADAIIWKCKKMSTVCTICLIGSRGSAEALRLHKMFVHYKAFVCLLCPNDI
ncbi:hypothetical protein M0R45_028032 [Rubus argutus]|uniref:Uncharacterized protein n=1 Tax=Rubus argutus TaxID=59490 RepID=A0AAW1W849_RUBAR